MRIIVAHPGKQHSYRLASALKKSGHLLYYITTVYDKKGAWLLYLAKRILTADNKKRANKQRNNDLEDKEVITFGTLGGFIEKLLVRFNRLKFFYNRVNQYNSNRFGIKVAKLAIKAKADMVICYDSNATTCFAYLKKHSPGIKRVMDVSIASRHYMKEIYDKEIREHGAKELYRDNKYMWNKERMLPMMKEIEDSDYFLSASNFVKDSLIFCGVKPEQIRIVPYGSNVSSNICREPIKADSRVEFLFVGQVIYRKGVSYAISAAKQISIDKAHLTITGRYNRNDSFIDENLNDDHLTFTGLVTLDKMQKIYEKSHVFVLPSFAEGMAQVGIEAMACGLPIICTYNSGVSDLVVNGVNGFIIPAGDADALVQRMNWFIENKDMILLMGENAKKTASKYTWDNYEKCIVKVVEEL